MAEIERQDPLRRFTPTPYTAVLPVMERTVRLESNDLKILRRAAELFAPYPGSPNGHVQFVWRIISQSHPVTPLPWPRRSTFSDRGLRFAQFGQMNFIAVDLYSREGIALISETLAQDDTGFISPFIDTIFYMTTGSLGLISLTAACVALDEKGLLVIGPPNSGKTTACYLAAKLGLEFHADQAVFLDMGTDGLRAWGDFVLAAFRPDTLEYLPELQASVLPFSYCDFTFYYLDKRKFQPARAHAVFPVCCVVLERGSALPASITPLTQVSFSKRLSESLPFKDDHEFEAQRVSAIGALEKLPVYQLAYGSDPAVAAPFLCELLAGHSTPPTG